MLTAKGSGTTSETVVYSEMKQRWASSRGPVIGNETDNNSERFVNKTTGISLDFVQHINGNRV
jgi:hypothetical protein